MRWVFAAIMTACISFAAPASAQTVDEKGNYFSPDPDDTRGPPIHFFANLSADGESAVAKSPGVGRVDFMLDRPSLRLSWTLTYRNLTSPAIGVHIHGPQTPGGEAGIMFDLAPQGMHSPLTGSVVLNDSDLIYLLQDRLYVNLKTAKYKEGELRGEVRRARPKP